MVAAQEIKTHQIPPLIVLPRTQEESTPQSHEEELRQQKINRHKRVLDLASMRAFFTYNMFCSPELIASNEDVQNRHHGYEHIGKVEAYYKQNNAKSQEHMRSNERAKETLRYANAEALAVRFHDIIQQHLLLLGCGKESKVFHGEIAGLYLLLIAPELKRSSGYSTRDIYRAAAMCYKHSDPEEVGDDFVLPNIKQLASQLNDQLDTYRSNAKAAGKEVSLPETLAEFFPLAPKGSHFNLTTAEFARRLDVGNGVRIRKKFKESESAALAYHIKRVAYADMSDAIFPPDKANLRTLETRSKRNLFVEMNSENALLWLNDTFTEVDSKLDHDPTNSNLIEKKQNLLRLIDRVSVLDGEPFPVELEFEIRMAVSYKDAPDDFSRIMFECLRDYRAGLDLTEFEASQLESGMVSRLVHFLEVAEMLENTDPSLTVQQRLHQIISSDSQMAEFAQFLLGAGKAKQEFFSKGNLQEVVTRMRELALIAKLKVREMYGENHEEVIENPVGNVYYDFAQPTYAQAFLMMMRKMDAWYDRYKPRTNPRARQAN